jgi:hypothetical protein
MLGHKKDKNLIYLGQKKDKHQIFLGNKQDLNKNNGVTNNTGNGIIEQHKNLNQFAPLGLLKK